jgi:ferredoxin--NADP+ reductase
MYRIVEKTVLGPGVKRLVVLAPRIASKSQPGQFVILRVDEKGERIPLTIVGEDTIKGTITLIMLEAGKTTRKLGAMKVGDSLVTLSGPLGKPTDVSNHGTSVVVGGGVGIAEAYPEAKALKESGNYVISIIGARSSELLLLEEEMNNVSDELYISTDDGSKGHKGFVTDVLKILLDERDIDYVYAVGPTIMMRVVSDTTRPYGVKTVVSLNPIMIDGTGMCGGCRVTVNGQNRFACVDGPAFDGHLVDFHELMSRQRMFHDQEKCSLDEYEQSLTEAE